MLKTLNRYLTTLLLRKRMESFKAGYDASAGDALRKLAEFECPNLDQLDGHAFVRGSIAAAEDTLKLVGVVKMELDKAKGEQT